MSDPTQPQKRSKDFVAVLVLLVVIGLIVVFVLPGVAFQNVRASSQDKAVLSRLEILQSAADQYFAKNGVSSVASVTLIGTNSTDWVSPFQAVAQETYTPIIVQGAGISAWGVAGARTVTFGP